MKVKMCTENYHIRTEMWLFFYKTSYVSQAIKIHIFLNTKKIGFRVNFADKRLIIAFNVQSLKR